jgi:hypothetical protein
MQHSTTLATAFFLIALLLTAPTPTILSITLFLLIYISLIAYPTTIITFTPRPSMFKHTEEEDVEEDVQKSWVESHLAEESVVVKRIVPERRVEDQQRSVIELEIENQNLRREVKNLRAVLGWGLFV